LAEKYKGNEEALLVLNNAMGEIELYKKYSAYYGWEFYLLRATNDSLSNATDSGIRLASILATYSVDYSEVS
jgi:hypothetical protein